MTKTVPEPSRQAWNSQPSHRVSAKSDSCNLIENRGNYINNNRLWTRCKDQPRNVSMADAFWSLGERFAICFPPLKLRDW